MHNDHTNQPTTDDDDDDNQPPPQQQQNSRVNRMTAKGPNDGEREEVSEGVGRRVKVTSLRWTLNFHLQ